MTERTSIGFWVQEVGRKGFGIHAVGDLTLAEFDEYHSAIAAYRSVVERHTYHLLQRDWERIRSMRDFYVNLERIGGLFRAVDTLTVTAQFMGDVTNWLAATRLYLEAERDSLVRQFGLASEEIKRFSATTSRVFDSNEGYRFLYNLRDFSQHCGPPLGGLTVGAQPDGSRSVEPYLSRSDLLLARFSWSRHAKVLLESWDEQILLMPLIEQAMAGFREIEDVVVEMLIGRCADVVPVLRAGIARANVNTEGGHAAIFRLPPREGDGELAWQTFPPESGLNQVEAATAANASVASLRAPPLDPIGRMPPEVRHAQNQAAAVVGAWLEDGPGDVLNDAINAVLNQDRDITPVISGLVNLSAYVLSMLSISVGTTPQALVGSFVGSESPRSSPVNERTVDPPRGLRGGRGPGS